MVEKYVERDGCALHGHSHDHDHDHQHELKTTPSRSPISTKTTALQEKKVSPIPVSVASAPKAKESTPEPTPKSVAEEDDDEKIIPTSPSVTGRSSTERPKLFIPIQTTTTTTMTSTSSSDAKKLPSTVSPALGSPSVVKKARSLFSSSSSTAAATGQVETTTPSSPTPAAVAEPAVNKIRSSFESNSSSSLRRESTKIWEQGPATPVPRKLSNERNVQQSPTPQRKSSKETTDAPAPTVANKSRTPSPAKETPTTLPTPIQQAAKVENDSSTIEEIEDLALLEKMLSAATNYDDRSRIRAQLRIAKKKVGQPSSAVNSPVPVRKTAPVAPAAAPVEPEKPTPNRSGDVSSPLLFGRKALMASSLTSTTTTSSPLTSSDSAPKNKIEPVAVVSLPTAQLETDEPTPMQIVGIESVSRKSSVTTTTTSVRRTSKTYQSSTTSWTSASASGGVEEDGTVVSGEGEEGSVGGSPRSSRSSWRRQSSEANMASGMKTPTNEESHHPDTLDITSSYGTGPMDENGRPLFGLGALRRRPKQTSVSDVDGSATTPTPISITERSQPLTELQKLHEQQSSNSSITLKGNQCIPLLSFFYLQSEFCKLETETEKPRLKLRDTFTTDATASADDAIEFKEPIINERSQALREIIRHHEQGAIIRKIDN